MDVALVGCGHIGQHHARVIAKHPGCRLVALIDAVPERAHALAARVNAEARDSVPDGVEAVVIATPTTTHVELAGPHLRQGRWCLVEKPLAAAAHAARTLASPRLVVGHVERFNPAVRALGAVRPRFIEARRMSPPSGRGADVDVIFDLMVHDLDLVLHWFEGEVTGFDAVEVADEGRLVDTATVRLRTSDGLVANLVASRVAATPERVVRVFERGQTTVLDLRAGVATRDGQVMAHDDPRDGLTAQWDAFVSTTRGERSPAVDFDAGYRAVALAERISNAIRS